MMGFDGLWEIFSDPKDDMLFWVRIFLSFVMEFDVFWEVFSGVLSKSDLGSVWMFVFRYVKLTRLI